MRSFILTIGFLFVAFSINAQDVVPPKKVKYDYFKSSKSGKFLAIYKGKKAGIYNMQTKEFDVPMKKQIIIQSPVFDFFTVIGNEGYQTYSAFYTDTLIEMPKDELYFRFNSDQFLIEDLKDGRYLFNDVETPNLGSDPNDPENDLWDFDHTFLGSGLFNFETSSWEIPRRYYRLYKVGDQIICLKRDSTKFKETGHFADEYLFDIYKKDGTYQLYKSNVDTIADFIDPIYFGCDSLYSLADGIHYIGLKNGMKGLIRMDPFAWDIRLKKHAFFDRILPYEYSVIWDNPVGYGFYCVRPGHPAELFYFVEEQDSIWEYHVKRPDSKDYLGWGVIGFDSIPSKYTPQYSTETEVSYSTVQILNDSIVKLVDSYAGNWIGLKSKLYPGEDSIANDGQFAYRIEGDYDSIWIYNFIKDEILYNGMARDVHFAGDHFVKLDREGQITLLDLDLNQIGGPYKHDDFFGDMKLVEGLFATNEYLSIERMGSKRTLDSENEYVFNCKRKDGKVDLFLAEKGNLTPTALELGSDLAWYEQKTETGVFVKDDQLIYQMVDTTFVFPMNYGVHLYFDATKSPYEYTFSYQVDTQHFEIKREVEVYGFNYENVSLQVAVYKQGDEIIGDFAAYKSEDIYDDYWFESWGSIPVKREYSAVWQKSDEGYERKSTYYFSIQPCRDLYIVQTGSYPGEVQYDDKGEPLIDPHTNWLATANKQESRFLLLGADLKGIQMLDYYDFDKIVDLGFGLEITTSKGKFFATYDGVAVTDDGWDKFTLSKDGKLMAIREAKEIEDLETGDFIHVDGVVKTFDLPKK